ncbi:pentatricopeptide repeat protein [Nannizzia gypsea CBS 118893]|uniref:Pentatricopeptide repeat protein n=1 Tax=Arthroderma gypseum (strain ATCC MYA-4604 / CBS 118893) TaxID=535722 RepID=E4V4U6_ARTGP|nr:pentatricopeptide repeat protein [Nannizzia gypsea CBS 118893]EFR05020.1 pentatricopeptide repeat protein [Nannizzia gypsea CBS 118893]
MLRPGNFSLGCTRASRASTILTSARNTTSPVSLLSRTQHPSYLIRHYTPIRTWKKRNSSGSSEISPDTTQWGTKDRYRTIEQRGKWQRKAQMKAAETVEDRDLEEDQEEAEENEDDENGHIRPEPKKRMSQAEFEREMQFINYDRVALARRVNQLLKLGHEERATLLVWASQNAKIDCIVSWNALIEHKMKNGRRKEAVKLFNDMKKRGRSPNEQTFTILLSGLATGSSKYSSETALNLFESMKNSNSESKPNIIHINAVLNVCARNRDMKSLWAFAGEIPEYGESAPNSVTYTIILNAIRTSVLEFTDTLDPSKGPRAVKEISRRKRIAVSSGKKLWGEIISKWRKGDLVLDSRLVTSMARLLAIEDTEKSYFDVLRLYKQCMSLRVPPAIEAEVMKLQSIPDETSDDNELLTREEKKRKEEERNMLLHLFDPVDLAEIRAALKGKPGSKKHPAVSLPAPTNVELSLLIQICQKMAHNGIASGRHYWTALTSAGEDSHNVKPDSSSCHEYLRLLRHHRASAESLKVIENHMVSENLVAGKTITIALSTCSRDRNNPNVLDTANRILDISAVAPKLDPSYILRYIELVRALINKEKLVSDSTNIDKARLKYSPNSLPTVPTELHLTRLLKALAHLRLRTQDIIELLAFSYIRYEKIPIGSGFASSSQDREREPNTISNAGPDDAEKDVTAQKALRKLKTQSFAVSGKAPEAPSRIELLKVLWQSHSLYKRILNPQPVSSSFDSARETISVSSFLSDSDRDWLAKDCERLSMFAPYFKQFATREVMSSDVEADREQGI